MLPLKLGVALILLILNLNARLTEGKGSVFKGSNTARDYAESLVEEIPRKSLSDVDDMLKEIRAERRRKRTSRSRRSRRSKKSKKSKKCKKSKRAKQSRKSKKSRCSKGKKRRRNGSRQTVLFYDDELNRRCTKKTAQEFEKKKDIESWFKIWYCFETRSKRASRWHDNSAENRIERMKNKKRKRRRKDSRNSRSNSVPEDENTVLFTGSLEPGFAETDLIFGAEALIFTQPILRMGQVYKLKWTVSVCVCIITSTFQLHDVLDHTNHIYSESS